MNKHLTEGELRASLDLELNQERVQHLENCPECQAQQRMLQAKQNRTAVRLAFLTPGEEPVPSAKSAWSRFPYRPNQHKEISMLKRLFAFPVARVAAALVFMLALVLAIPQTRAMASELLNLFRVQKVEVISFDASGMEKITGNDALGEQLSKLLSDTTEVSQEAGEPVTVSDAAAASAAAGYNVRLPENMTASTIMVSGASAFSMTLDRAKAQGLLDEAGRSDLVLPENIDGARLSVSIPTSVNATFGTCPDVNSETEDPDQEFGNFNAEEYADCLVFGQMPSPTVNAPASLDVEALAQIALEFTGMEPEEAANLVASVDWTSTLVVPLPRGTATHSEISVDGVSGTLIQQDSEYAPSFVLIWVKDGIVYFVSAPGSDTSRALNLIKALP